MEEKQLEQIIRAVLSRLQNEKAHEGGLIPAEMSARHVHLTAGDLRELFGTDTLQAVKSISQPGQFLSDCRVRLIGPKGSIDNVAVLGPVRKATQVEISATDCRTLGISAPVRLSGQLEDAAEIHIQAGNRIICRRAAIVAQRHLHMTPKDAENYHVKDGDRVSVRVLGARPLILEDTPVRVTEQSALALHMDTDEANAAGAGKDCKCAIVSVACSADAQACSTAIVPCSGSPAPCSAAARTCSDVRNPGIIHAPGAPYVPGTAYASGATGASGAPYVSGTAHDPGTAHAPGAPMGAPSTQCASIDGKLICEGDIFALQKQGIKCILLRKGQLITPLARDAARQAQIRLEDKP